MNEVDPSAEDAGITIEDTNDERTIYLISDEDGDTRETVERWLETNYSELFEAELEGWYSDPGLWPENRTLKLFKEWFEVECHTVLIDTVDDAIYDEDI